VFHSTPEKCESRPFVSPGKPGMSTWTGMWTPTAVMQRINHNTRCARQGSASHKRSRTQQRYRSHRPTATSTRCGTRAGSHSLQHLSN
jgi:hypothetical protein